MPQPLSFRWDDEFITRIDAARGPTKRSAWVRAACERALAAAPGEVVAAVSPQETRDALPPPAPRAPSLQRGSPSPSLARFAGDAPKGRSSSSPATSSSGSRGLARTCWRWRATSWMR